MAITLPDVLAAQLETEAQAQNCSVEELLSHFLRQAQNDSRRRETMVEIKKLSEQITEKFNPEKIILFGSYAYGVPREGSDIDLLVIMPFEGRHREQAVKIHSSLNTLEPIELLVRRPEEVAERIALGDSFIREIMEQGKVLYESKPGS